MITRERCTDQLLVSAAARLPRSDLSGNRISGSLPEAWGGQGAFPRLLQLLTPRNALSGTLPPSWGGGLPALTQL